MEETQSGVFLPDSLAGRTEQESGAQLFGIKTKKEATPRVKFKT